MMLFEPREPIELRQAAAHKWLEDYANEIRDEQPAHRLARALMVIVLTEKTSDFLAEHDPQALKQAQVALNGKSWEDFMLMPSEAEIQAALKFGKQWGD